MKRERSSAPMLLFFCFMFQGNRRLGAQFKAIGLEAFVGGILVSIGRGRDAYEPEERPVELQCAAKANRSCHSSN